MYLEIVMLGIVVMLGSLGLIYILIKESKRVSRDRYIARMRNRLLRFGR